MDVEGYEMVEVGFRTSMLLVGYGMDEVGFRKTVLVVGYGMAVAFVVGI